MNYRKYTPLFIFLMITEFILVILTINFLFIDNKGGAMLGGVIAGFGAAINLLLIGFERAIAEIKSINIKILWIVEILIILLFISYILFHGISIG